MVSGWLLYLPVIALIAGLAHFLYADAACRSIGFRLFCMAVARASARSARIGLILAAVTNTMAEANILIQLLYMPMLFLSGTTIPSSILPVWAQTVAEFMPATYLVTGFQGIFFRNQRFSTTCPRCRRAAADHGDGAFPRASNCFVGRRKKNRRRAIGSGWPACSRRSWSWAASAPTTRITWARTRRSVPRSAALRHVPHSQHRASFVGDGNGEARTPASWCTTARSPTSSIGAGPRRRQDPRRCDRRLRQDAAARPDRCARASASARRAFPISADDYDRREDPCARDAAALLYSGVTAARSTGDGLDASLKLRGRSPTAAKLGARAISSAGRCSRPRAATAPSSRAIRSRRRCATQAEAQLVRARRRRADEARQQVRRSEEGRASTASRRFSKPGLGDGMLFNRMDVALLRGGGGGGTRAEPAAGCAHRRCARCYRCGRRRRGIDRARLLPRQHSRCRAPATWRTTASISIRRCGVAEAYANFYRRQGRRAEQLAGAADRAGAILKGTRDFARVGQGHEPGARRPFSLQRSSRARVNLAAGVEGRRAAGDGNRRRQPAGLPRPLDASRTASVGARPAFPPAVALQAATGNAAKLLRADNRFGSIRKGMDANLLMVDGNPLQDITATERISLVVYKGERLRRSELFDQK